MVDDFLEVPDERRGGHSQILKDFLTDSEEPDCYSAVELDEMGEEGFEDLLSFVVGKTFVIDKFVRSAQNGLFVFFTEITILFRFLLTNGVIVGEGILKIVLILFILIHN